MPSTTLAMPSPRRPRHDRTGDTAVGLLQEAPAVDPAARPHGRHCACWPCARTAVPYLALLDDTETRMAAVQQQLRTGSTPAVTG